MSKRSRVNVGDGKGHKENNRKRKSEKSNIKYTSVEKESKNDDDQPWSKSKKKRMRRLMGQKKNNHNQQEHMKSVRQEMKKNQKKPRKNEDDEKNIESNNDETNEKSSNAANDDTAASTISLGGRPKSALQQTFLARLSGSRFRELNEELYTTTSSAAYKRFTANPELFEQYHEGFRSQVKHWPVNPVDVILRSLLSLQQSLATSKRKDKCEDNKPSDRNKKLVVADFGCGDAKLAQKLLGAIPNSKKKKKNKTNNVGTGESSLFTVHSFDLVSNGNPLITPCDMSNVPIKDGCVDVGVFSLALMGTNIADFIREAHRVLSPDGILKIAEVRSRFESSTSSALEYVEEEEENKVESKSITRKRKRDANHSNLHDKTKQRDESILDEFLYVMKQLGFRCIKKDQSNKMFILLDFEKTGTVPSKDATFTAKPCIYKRR